MKKLTQKTSLFLLCIGIISLVLPSQTRADQVSLQLSPSMLRIEAKPPADVWTPFVIKNNSDQPASLTIGYRALDPLASSNGTVVFLKNGKAFTGQDQKIFSKMQIVDDANISHDSIDLGPKQKERLRLRILLPVNEPISDYYFTVLLLQTPNKNSQNDSNVNIESQKSHTSLEEGIGMNVLLAVGDKETPQGTIQTFAAPFFSDTGLVPFTLSVSDEGTHFIIPKGIILIKNIFGQTVGKLPIPSSIILAGTSRTLGNTVASENDGSSSQIIFPEKFLLGLYTATVTLNLSDKGPVYVRTIHFFAFPVLLVCEILFILVIVWYIYLRVKRKLS